MILLIEAARAIDTVHPAQERRSFVAWISMRWEYLAVPTLIALLSLPGFTQLKADQDLHLTDLGYWASNARNVVLWGSPFQDNYNLAVLAPLQYLMAKLVFMITGPGIVAARLVGGIKVYLLLFVTYLFARYNFGWRVAIIALVLLGSTTAIVQMARQSCVEPLPGLLLLLAVFCYFDRRERLPSALLAGLFAGASLAAKPTAAFSMLPFVIWLAVDFVRNHERRRIWATAGSLGLVIACQAVFVAAHWQNFLAMQQAEASILSNGAGQNVVRFFTCLQHPAVFPSVLWGLFGAGSIALACTRPSSAWRQLRGMRLTGFLILWLVLKTVLNPLVTRTQLARRFDDIFPVVAILAALMIVRILQSDATQERGSRIKAMAGAFVLTLVLLPLWARVAAIFGVSLVLPAVTVFLLGLPTASFVSRLGLRNAFGYALLFLSCTYLLLYLDRPDNIAPVGLISLLGASLAVLIGGASSVAKPMRLALVALSVLALLSPITPYLTGRGFAYGPFETREGFTYDAYRFAKRCGERFQDGEYVVGDEAHTFCLESRAIPIAYDFGLPDIRNINKGSLNQYHPRWAILLAANEGAPEKHLFASAPVDSWGTAVYLYRLGPADYEAATRYQARFR